MNKIVYSSKQVSISYNNSNGGFVAPKLVDVEMDVAAQQKPRSTTPPPEKPPRRMLQTSRHPKCRSPSRESRSRRARSPSRIDR